MGQTSSTACMSSTTVSSSSSSDPDSGDDSPQSSVPSSSRPVVRSHRRSLRTIQSDNSETSDDNSGDSSPHRISFSSDEESNVEGGQQLPVPRSLSGSHTLSSSSSSLSSSDSDNDFSVTMPSSTVDDGANSQQRTGRVRRAPRRLVSAASDEGVFEPPTVNLQRPPATAIRVRGRPRGRRPTAPRAIIAVQRTPSPRLAPSAAATVTTTMASSAPIPANPVNNGIGMMQRLLSVASSVINQQAAAAAVRAIPSTGPAVNVVAPPDPPITATTSSTAAAVGNVNAAVSYFECVVCLENLDSPATILEPLPRTAVSNQELVIHIQNLGIIPNSAAGASGGGPVQVQVQSPPTVRRRTAAEKRETALAEVDPREICATNCGHMYHKYCIQKWFNEQGRKTCPSCRKNVGTKMIRLFPNVAQDAPGQMASRTGLGDADVATTSTTDGSGGVVVGAPRRMPRSGCGNAACADLVTIHGTLVSDYNALRELYNTAKDDLEVRKAEIASLQDGYDNRGRELDDLRNSGAAAANNEHASKRPRRR